MLVPPLAVRLFQKLRKKNWEYSGVYSSWQEAEKNAGGYDAAEILEKVFSATQKVLAGEAVFERDSVLFYQEEYNIPLLKALFQIARQKGRLHVLDFGGALGSVFFQNGPLLKAAIKDIEWTVEPRRVRCFRMNNLSDMSGFDVPLETQYAMKLESSEPIVVQYGRLDNRQTNLAYYTTLAY